MFIASIANLKAGTNEPFTYEDIYKVATACLEEILRRVKAGKMKSSISVEKDAII